MQDLGLGAGLASLAFWGFIATAVVAGIWDGIRKREAKHETVRRLLESGQNIDSELMDKLITLTDGKSERPDRVFFITGLWILPVAAGLAVFGLVMGNFYPQTYAPLLGVSAMLAVLGLGFLVASKIVGRWYVDKDSSIDI
jgi:hypothetical protein